MLSALRVYKPFKEAWKKETLERKEETRRNKQIEREG
jgi:hypothetical protein